MLNPVSRVIESAPPSNTSEAPDKRADKICPHFSSRDFFNLLSGLQQSQSPQPLPAAVDEIPHDFTVRFFSTSGGGQDVVSRARRVDLSGFPNYLPLSWRFGSFVIGSMENSRRIAIMLDETSGNLCVDGQCFNATLGAENTRQDWSLAIMVAGRKADLSFYRFYKDHGGRHLYYQSNYHRSAQLLSTDADGRQTRHELQLIDTGTLLDWRFPNPPMRSDQFLYDFGFGDYGAVGRELMERVLTERTKGTPWVKLIDEFAADPAVSAQALDVLRRNQHYDWETFGHLPPSIFAKIRNDLQSKTAAQILEDYKADPSITPEMRQLVERNIQQNEIRLMPSYAVDQDGDGTLETTGFFGTPFVINDLELTVKSAPASGEQVVLAVRKAPPQDGGESVALHTGAVAPAITGQVIFGPQKGQAMTIGGASKDFAGKLVVVDFWATWCGPCLRGFPHLLEVQKKFTGKPVAILGINRDFDIQDPAYVTKYIAAAHLQKLSEVRNLTPEQWQARFDEFSKTHPEAQSLNYFTDRDNVSGRLWGVTAIPALFLLDGSTGKVLAQGDALRDPKALEAEISRQLGLLENPAKP